MSNMKNREKGFTLVELLVVIAIIGILAAVIFVALDPATRFADARDAVRQNDVQEILSAVKIYQVDEGGDLPVTTAATTPPGVNAGDVYMIGDATGGCDADVSTSYTCSGVTSSTHCIDLSDKLVTDGYLGQEPVSPDGQGTWDQSLSGYTYSVDSNGLVTIGSCENEGGGSAIQAIR